MRKGRRWPSPADGNVREGDADAATAAPRRPHGKSTVPRRPRAPRAVFGPIPRRGRGTARVADGTNMGMAGMVDGTGMADTC